MFVVDEAGIELNKRHGRHQRLHVLVQLSQFLPSELVFEKVIEGKGLQHRRQVKIMCLTSRRSTVRVCDRPP
jgi:hypothetical protein